jgi:DNA processing protein
MVVAPAGYRVAYPEKNARLFGQVLERGGAYLSLAADGQKARRASFFERNALLAALAHVVVVVQAGFRSGARNTARWARRLERPLLVVPSSPWNAKGRGCLLELKRGADLCTGIDDVLRPLERVLALPARSLGSTKRKQTAPAQGELPFFEPSPVSGEEGQVLRAVRAGATHLDAICERSGLSASAVQRLILTLTLGGVIGPGPGGLRLLPPTQWVSLSKTK